MLRTIFFPLVRRGAPRLVSLLVVFLISAVMHELAVGVPLRMLRGWAFWGMMAQVRSVACGRVFIWCFDTRLFVCRGRTLLQLPAT